MKIAALLILAMVAITVDAGTSSAADNAQAFVAAMAAYKAEDYPSSIEALEAIATDGIVNGHLYYNLGNAHLKNGDLGRAILWYARATHLLPNDPDLRFNYAYARTLTRDASENDSIPLAQIFFFWNYQLSNTTIIALSILFNGLFWTLAIAWRLSGRRGLRLAAQLALLPTLVFAITVGFNYYEARTSRHAIILEEEIAVRSGLEETSTELFILHAGAKVKIVKERNGYNQIRYSPEKTGWLPAGAIGRI